MMIRPGELAAIKRGEVNLAFRRWDRPRVRVGTRMRTSVGLIEVTSVEATTVSALRAADATRAGAESLAALKKSATYRSVGTLYQIGLTYAGADPRDELRATIRRRRRSPRSGPGSIDSTRRRRRGPGPARPGSSTSILAYALLNSLIGSAGRPWRGKRTYANSRSAA